MADGALRVVACTGGDGGADAVSGQFGDEEGDFGEEEGDEVAPAVSEESKLVLPWSGKWAVWTRTRTRTKESVVK